MRTRGLGAIAGAVWLVTACGASLAATVEDSQRTLVRLYTLSVAIDTCPGVDVSEADETRLDKAISAVELQLSLTEEASETLYDQLSAAADNDKDGFCGGLTPTLKSEIEKLPE